MKLMAVKRQANNAVKITAPLQGCGQTIAGLGRPLRPTRPRLTVSQAINQGLFSRVQKEFLKSRMENPNCISRWIARGTSNLFNSWTLTTKGKHKAHQLAWFAFIRANSREFA